MPTDSVWLAWIKFLSFHVFLTLLSVSGITLREARILCIAPGRLRNWPLDSVRPG